MRILAAALPFAEVDDFGWWTGRDSDGTAPVQVK